MADALSAARMPGPYSLNCAALQACTPRDQEGSLTLLRLPYACPSLSLSHSLILPPTCMCPGGGPYMLAAGGPAPGGGGPMWCGPGPGPGP